MPTTPATIEEIKITPMNIHAKESTTESQAILNELAPKFSQQCYDLLEYMLRGYTVNTKSAMNDLDIWKLASRISDLIRLNNVPIHKERKRSEKHKFKFIEYSILPEHRKSLIEQFNITL